MVEFFGTQKKRKETPLPIMEKGHWRATYEQVDNDGSRRRYVLDY